MASSGQPATLTRPLDFLVVADHSDQMRFFPDFFAGKPEILADPAGKSGTTSSSPDTVPRQRSR